MGVFEKRTLIKPNIFQKMFNIPVKENFLREIENFLADCETVDGEGYLKFTENNFLQLLEKYKIKELKIYEESFKDYFSKILKKALSDEILTDAELKDLEHIKNLFGISENFVKSEIEKLTSEIYKKEVGYVINDGIISDEEKQTLENVKKNLKLSDEKAKSIFNEKIKEDGEEIYRRNVRWTLDGNEISPEEEQKLEKIQNTLLLSDATAEAIYAQEAKEIYQRYFNSAIADERLSPDEEQQLKELAEKLHTDINYDYATQKLLDKYRLFWLIENGEVPTISSDINIQKSEKLYFKTKITWYELRKETIRTSYSGLTYRSGNLFGIKGLSYRNGNIYSNRITEDVLKPIDEGILYLTNKRFIFTGGKGNKNINLKKVLSFEVFSDGVQIEKDSGKSPFFHFSNDTDLFSMFLSRALHDC